MLRPVKYLLAPGALLLPVEDDQVGALGSAAVPIGLGLLQPGLQGFL